MMDCNMVTPQKRPRENSFHNLRSSSQRALTAIKKKVSNVEYSIRSSNTRELLVNSPKTPKTPVTPKSRSATPAGSAQRHGVNLNDYDFDEESNLMRTPTRSGKMKTPPCRPSKRRSRIQSLLNGPPGKSIDISTVGFPVEVAGTPGLLTAIMEDCSLSVRRRQQREKSPPRTPRSSRKSGKKVSRILHRVQTKISK